MDDLVLHKLRPCGGVVIDDVGVPTVQIPQMVTWFVGYHQPTICTLTVWRIL